MAAPLASPRSPKDYLFEWEGKDRNGHTVRDQLRATSQDQVQTTLRRQGILTTKIKKRRTRSGKAVKPKDIAIFTRQLATLMKAGVPLLQSFDIVARGHPEPNVVKLIDDIRHDIETGTSLSAAFRKFPAHFDPLYCNLVAAGESAGALEDLLDRLATHMEKSKAIKSKIKSALVYPISVVVAAFVVVAIIMIFVIPAFEQVFTSFGTELPLPTQIVMAISAAFVAYWWLIFGLLGGAIFGFIQSWKRNPRLQQRMDRLLLRLPIFGALINKSCLARWTRTLATMFAAGVPLIEALDSVAGAAGNSVYADATRKIAREVSTGTNLATAMTHTHLFPPMALQMTAIGEESGSIEHMLTKVADFYESEVDDLVLSLASLMEPLIIVFLGLVIGAIVVAMYLPILRLGQVV